MNMHKLILVALLVPATPAFACTGSTGYQWGPDGNIEAVCSNAMGYAGGASGGAAPAARTCGAGMQDCPYNNAHVWDSPGVTYALGAFSALAGATGNSVASGVFGFMGVVSAANDAGAFGAFSAGIGSNDAGFGDSTGYGGGL